MEIHFWKKRTAWDRVLVAPRILHEKDFMEGKHKLTSTARNIIFKHSNRTKVCLELETSPAKATKIRLVIRTYCEDG